MLLETLDFSMIAAKSSAAKPVFAQTRNPEYAAALVDPAYRVRRLSIGHIEYQPSDMVEAAQGGTIGLTLG